MSSVTYNGVTCQATGARSSSRSDKKWMRTVRYKGKERLVHYGDPNMEIKRDNPARRKAFNDRHNCSSKKDPFAPGFWSCYHWRARAVDSAGGDEHTELAMYTEFASTALYDGRPFDALASGEWTDMHGRTVTLEAEEFPDIVANTKIAIASATTASGELVGLPIDQRGHEKQEAAGWIVDVQLAGDIIQVYPRWNEEGRRLIEGGIMRGFSATIDLRNKVILGGSLVNWPALVRHDGTRALRPVELSQETTMDEAQAPEVKVDEVHEEHDQAAGDIELSADNTKKGANHMDITRDELSSMVAGLVKQTLEGEIANVIQEYSAPVTQNGTGEEAEGEDILSVLNLEGYKGNVIDAVKQRFLDQYEQMYKEGERQALRMVARVRREADVADFAGRMVGGTDKHPRGIAIEEEQLATWMLSLNETQLEFAKDLLTKIQEQGLVEFKERGHAGQMETKEELPEYYANKLDAGEMTVNDLKHPMLNLDWKRYDLSAWEGK